MVYRTGSEIVANILGKLDRMGEKWQRRTIEAEKDWEEWYKVFKQVVEPYLMPKAGQHLNTKEALDEYYNKVREAAKRYAQLKSRR